MLSQMEEEQADFAQIIKNALNNKIEVEAQLHDLKINANINIQNLDKVMNADVEKIFGEFREEMENGGGESGDDEDY